MGSAAPAIRYGLFARLADRRHATRDGKAGLPTVGSEAPLTPTFEVLRQTYEDRQHHERKLIRSDTAELRGREAALVARIHETGQEAIEVEKRLEAMPEHLSPAELEQRNGGEANTDMAVVRMRRIREHDARRSPLLSAAWRLRQQLQELRIELGQTRRSIRNREVMGALEVSRLHAHTMRRIAAYERRLVLIHPAGVELVSQLTLHHPRLPDWVRSFGDGPELDGYADGYSEEPRR
ncbi:MAG: hypothetical protein GEU83_06325 [Pseudonocardiaceae bacterium]|nr:hypothetical protein [Pseudonocardiaceae bacterium]